ncbi:MAG: acetylornithine transaminase [Actinobacteria bacterium]|nr:acetylornithine transaminase [Actinomycetota bacterium]
MANNYGTPALTLVRGEGARVWDIEGTEYLDLVAGIAVNSLGHAHPAVVEAVSRQVATLGHTSNLAIHEPGVRLAERLLAVLDPEGARGGRVFFCNSGAEANEAAFKLSRLTGRTQVVAATNSFHGRTMGALALTGQPAKQDPFRPLPGDVTFVEYGDTPALTEAVTATTAAVVLEPVQGEGGVLPAPDGYLTEAQEIAHASGALLILDEVQTGVGRTGNWFAFQQADVAPDVVTLAKGLGGGLPIGAMVAFGAAATLLTPGTHGSTFGGNPVSCAAALAVLDTIDEQGLVARASTVGEYLSAQLAGHSLVAYVRGHGLMLGVVLNEPLAREVEVSARQHGVLVNAIGADVIRLVPPLTITDDDVRLFLDRWPKIVDAALGVKQ